MSLEQMLRDAGASADWPRTPDLEARIRARLGADRSTKGAGARSLAHSAPRVRLPIRRALVLGLAVLLAAAASAAAVPGVRNSVLDWLGLRSVRIERVPRPLPEPSGARLSLGRQMPLADARRRIAFVPLLPIGLGAPTVYYEDFPAGGRLGLVYRGGQLFLTEVEGSLDSRFLFKFLEPGTPVERVRIRGQRGLWLAGMHQFAYADRNGQIRTESVRTTGPVLLWRRSRLLLRLEGARTKAEALRIATSLRAAP